MAGYELSFGACVMKYSSAKSWSMSAINMVQVLITVLAIAQLKLQL
jgi:hypothetical protein